MRWVLLVLASLCFGCDDEAYYADGTPWENVAVPFRAPAIPIGSMDARQQATYFAQQGIQATGGRVQSFTPTWTGFSSPPIGEMFYQDFGEIVFMWSDDGFAGTSDANTMAMGNIPDQILPRTGFRIVQVVVEDNSIPQKVGALYMDTDNTAGFALGNVPAGGGAMTFLTTGWTAAGGKGLAPGFIAIYAK